MYIMNRIKLNKILASHKKWLETNGKKGTRADLTDCDLRGCYLKGYDLRYSNLTGCNLEGSDLIVCNLTNSDLTVCDLSGCNLTGCYLQAAGVAKGQKVIGNAYITRVTEFNTFDRIEEWFIMNKIQEVING